MAARALIERMGLAIGVHSGTPSVLYWRDAHEVESTDDEGAPVTVPVPAGWHVLRLGRWPREERTWEAIEDAIAAAVAGAGA